MQPQTRVRRHPERAVPDATARILEDGLVAHVGFVENGWPLVVPLMYHFDPSTYPDRVYVHGARASRAMSSLAKGTPACLEVTLLDGLVYSRAAESHSANYRSAMVFGRGRAVTDEQTQRDVFDAMTRRYFPDRTRGRDYQPVTSDYLSTTALVEITIEDWSGKARTGGPLGVGDDDPTAPGTAGVVDLEPAGRPA
ncbi:MAG: pyridoxamine 5'-phosphate oxidase family protein [Chloroflexi bacterium]|nr:pyridoxamine 5'-phosphate oxidase family protein [Chloroflexota bacterium]MBV9547938.1 pyridoxamine 5'-phosphate oxidase family protein [Chloroflexota bacterium]